MKLKKIIAGFMAAAVLLTCAAKPELSGGAVISASAASLLETTDVLKEGVNTGTLENLGNEHDYKFIVPYTGRVRIDYTFSMSAMRLFFMDSTGADVSYKYHTNAGGYGFKDGGTTYAYSFHTWNTNTQIGAGYLYMDLKAGTYYMRARKSGKGTGAGDYKFTLTTPTGIAVGKPKAGEGSVTLAWNPVDGASKYEVLNVTTGISEVTNDTKITLSGLDNGKTYTFKVRAYLYSSIWGEYSRELTATPYEIPAPAKPATVKATAGYNQATVVCSTVKGCTNYRLFYTTDNGKTYKNAGDSSSRKWVVKNLKSNITYKFLVLAYNGTKWSKYTKGECYSPVVPKLSKPETVKSTAGKGKVKVVCSAVPGAETYRLFYTADNGRNYTNAGDSPDRRWVVTGLKAGKTYKFLVLAYDGKKWSSYTKGECTAPATPY